MIETPCVNICTVDPRSGLCRGCGRTVDEIARWAGMASGERRRIMAELQERRAGDTQAARAGATG
ncbi:MAG TPA: DUF1289 domain-containing protein [Pseudolabrys sp.]|nr:DUF1289 domain-containing protein [Pseudolabrys sp.]